MNVDMGKKKIKNWNPEAKMKPGSKKTFQKQKKKKETRRRNIPEGKTCNAEKTNKQTEDK